MSTLFQDLRYALRALRHNPGFALVAILSLALGIGANAAIFSLAYFFLLRPLPVPNASGVMVVQSQFRGESLVGLTAYSPVSYPDFDDLRRRSHSFAGLTASQYFEFGFAPDKAELPRMRFGALVSGNFFDVLGVHPELGRGFRADEDKVRGRDAVVVLGHELWTTEFASDPVVIGKTIFLNGLPFAVIGVTPESFHGPNAYLRADLYVPLAMEPTLQPRQPGESQEDELDMLGLRVMMVHGRLRPGVRVGQAAAEGDQPAACPSLPEDKQHLFIGGCDLRAGADPESSDAQHAGARDVGPGRGGTADRLRQRDEPDAEPRLRSFARDRRSAGHRSGTGPAGSAIATRA